MTFFHAKHLDTRGEEHLHNIHDVARAMKEIKSEHTNLLSLGSSVRVHRTAGGDAPIKERRVKRNGQWVWERVR